MCFYTTFINIDSFTNMFLTKEIFLKQTINIEGWLQFLKNPMTKDLPGFCIGHKEDKKIVTNRVGVLFFTPKILTFFAIISMVWVSIMHLKMKNKKNKHGN